jgi:hypothetical protein
VAAGSAQRCCKPFRCSCGLCTGCYRLYTTVCFGCWPVPSTSISKTSKESHVLANQSDGWQAAIAEIPVAGHSHSQLDRLMAASSDDQLSAETLAVFGPVMTCNLLQGSSEPIMISCSYERSTLCSMYTLCTLTLHTPRCGRTCSGSDLQVHTSESCVAFSNNLLFSHVMTAGVP